MKRIRLLFVLSTFLLSCQSSGGGGSLFLRDGLLSDIIGPNLAGEDGGTFSEESALDFVSEPGIGYHFAWEDIPESWSEHRTLVNDLGYSLSIDSAWIGVYRVQLAPCPEEESTWWERWEWIPSALAGHDDGLPDLSAYLDGFVEDLGAEGTLHLPRISLEEGRYCDVHLLYAETLEYALYQPVEPHMVGLTVYISGSWTAEWSAEPTEFTLVSSLGNGALLPFEEAVDLSERGVDVVFYRGLRTLFDGMDMAVMSATALEKSFLLNVVNNTRFEVINAANRGF